MSDEENNPPGRPDSPASPHNAQSPAGQKKRPSRRTGSGPGMAQSVAPPALNDKDSRVRWGLPAEEDAPGWYMVELNLEHGAGIGMALERFQELFSKIVPSEQLA